MNAEKTSVIEKFNTNFANNSSFNNIIIYGIGELTQIVLENADTRKICGLMDAAKTGTNIWGYQVLSYEEIAKIKNCIIVILARLSVINVIYRRIKSFCDEYKINVYNINGELLRDDSLGFKKQKCFSLEEMQLDNLIQSSEVVSFDVFDTLICRRVLRPRDIFSIIDTQIEDNSFVFSRERVKAEEDIREVHNPNIEQIYSRLQYNNVLTDEETKKLLEMEIKIETIFLTRREYMCALLKKLVDSGKRVFLISDMYLQEKYLKRILDDLGISGYEKLVVSCDYGVAKEEGLFEKVLKQYGINSSSWLHIGDNTSADIKAAQRAGLNVYKVFSTVEMLESSAYSSLLKKTLTIEENIIVSSFANSIYNNPFGGFDKTGKIIVDNDRKLAKLIIAPIVFKFSLWLMQALKKDEFDLVIFPSRDGYLLKRIYDVHKTDDLPQSLYLYTSRRSAMVAAADDEKSIKSIIEVSDTRGLKEIIETRFGIENCDDILLDRILLGDYSILKELCDVERVCYLKYLNKELPRHYKRVAFVDFVAMGTIQDSLQKILKKKFKGLYFMKRVSDGKGTEKLEVDSLYPVSDDYSATSKVYQYYYFLENILTSYEASVKRFDESGTPIFYSEKRSEKQINCLKGCHDEILKYCKEMFELCSYLKTWDSNFDIYDQILGFFSEDYCEIIESELLKMTNIDEFMGKQITEVNR